MLEIFCFQVNIVFNYDMPEDSDTYLHRVARAGRFGTKVKYLNFFTFRTKVQSKHVLGKESHRTVMQD